MTLTFYTAIGYLIAAGLIGILILGIFVLLVISACLLKLAKVCIKVGVGMLRKEID